tara:strand:+ start:2164 stop:2682 length:519 start_codon:yes stop_codon:yes gene_type:complete
MSGSVKARIALPDLTSAIDDATVLTLGEFRKATLDLIDTEVWLGFKYSGNYPLEQKGTSGESWNTTELIENESGFTYGFQLYNDATIQARSGTKRNGKPYANNSVGEFYAGFVQKSGQAAPLWMSVVDKIESDLMPALEIALLENIMNQAAGISEIELEANDKSIGTYNFEL